MSRCLYYFKPRDYLVNSYDYLMLYCKLFEILDGGWKLTCQLSSTLQGTTQDASNPFTVPVLIFYTLFFVCITFPLKGRYPFATCDWPTPGASYVTIRLFFSLGLFNRDRLSVRIHHSIPYVFNLLSSPAHLFVQQL